MGMGKYKNELRIERRGAGHQNPQEAHGKVFNKKPIHQQAT